MPQIGGLEGRSRSPLGVGLVRGFGARVVAEMLQNDLIDVDGQRFVNERADNVLRC